MLDLMLAGDELGAVARILLGGPWTTLLGLWFIGLKAEERKGGAWGRKG